MKIRMEKCAACHGAGQSLPFEVYGKSGCTGGRRQRCPVCKGSGKLIRIERTQHCPSCGQRLDRRSAETCSSCAGPGL